MSDNIRTALYDARYTVVLANRGRDGAPVLARVVGKHCETGDIVVVTTWLPADVAPGDLLAVAGDRRLLPVDGQQLQPGAAAAGGRRQREGAPGAAAPGDRGRPAPAGHDRMSDEPSTGRCEVALLGCGTVGSEVVRLLHEQAADLAARIGARWSWSAIAVRRPGPAARPAGRPELFTTDAEALVERRRRGRGRRGGRRHRAGPHAAAVARCAGRVGGHRQQGAAGRGRRDPARGGRRRGRRRPLLRGRRGRRDPAAAPAARVAGRRPDHPGARHRQRHHQLHPVPDGRDRRRLRRGAGGGHRAGLRGGRPDRRRRGVRRRRQGGDPGQAGVPHPGHAPRTCTGRASPR